MRNWTREWWQLAKQRYRIVTSKAVTAELDLAPEPKRTRCLGLVGELPILVGRPEIEDLVEAYIEHRVMPADLAGDARHLALATWYGCNILATWNCRHLANPNKLRHLAHIHGTLGYQTPTLATPFELLEAER